MTIRPGRSDVAEHVEVVQGHAPSPRYVQSWFPSMSRSRTATATPLAAVLQRFVRSQDKAENFTLVRLWEHWDRLFGPDMAALICPLGRSGDTLLLGAEDAIVIQEFTCFSDQILAKVNGFLGKPMFRHIHIALLQGRSPLNKTLVTTPSPRPAPPRPTRLGTPGTLPDDASPVARAYRTYVRFFTQGTTKTEDRQKNTCK